MNERLDAAGALEFPCDWELKVMGPAGPDFLALVQGIVAEHLQLLSEPVRVLESSGGRYVSVSLQTHAVSRARLEAAYSALRAHPDVRWTL